MTPNSGRTGVAVARGATLWRYPVRSPGPAMLAACSTTLFVVAALTVSGCGRPAPAAPPSAARPTTAPPVQTPAPNGATPQAVAHPSAPDPRVGAIFLGGSPTPTCSGAVLHSAAGDLVLTAAHCLAGGVHTTFVPGFSGDAGPHDTWSVEAVYLDPRWTSIQDPRADYAIARVAREKSGSIESQVGEGLLLAPLSTEGSVVDVTGYGLGEDVPIHCQASTATVPDGFLSLPCEGLVAGTSGAPWISDPSTVMGLTGGLHGGGCEDDVSYSPPFDEQLTRLLARAEQGGPPDAAPAAVEDDCPVPP
jgi:hypothetical protein